MAMFGSNSNRESAPYSGLRQDRQPDYHRSLVSVSQRVNPIDHHAEEVRDRRKAGVVKGMGSSPARLRNEITWVMGILSERFCKLL